MPVCDCGEHVTERFARVFGDNEQNVHSCPQCATERELNAGTAAFPDRDADRYDGSGIGL